MSQPSGFTRTVSFDDAGSKMKFDKFSDIEKLLANRSTLITNERVRSSLRSRWLEGENWLRDSMKIEDTKYANYIPS